MGKDPIFTTTPGLGNTTAGFTHVKVFSETMAKQRASMGEGVSLWLATMRRESKGFEIVDTIVTQSSDSEFHCLSITIFYRAELG